ncbi:MAG TPA: hypothetical protein VGC19_09430 [Rhodanobacter sp.]
MKGLRDLWTVWFNGRVSPARKNLHMPTPVNLSAKDYENLARVAQGQSSLLSESCARQLIDAGLVLEMEASEVSRASLQLTSAGLALIRSSDQ